MTMVQATSASVVLLLSLFRKNLLCFFLPPPLRWQHLVEDLLQEDDGAAQLLVGSWRTTSGIAVC